MATSDPNDTDQKTLSLNDLVALTGRLVRHADGIQNIAAQGMADDMRLAAQAIEHLMRPAAEDMPEAVTKGPPELISITSLKALFNRLLDHGQDCGDETIHADIETVGRLVFTLWDVIERAGIKDPAIEMKPAAEGC
jgi:hypothetical protein